MVATEKEPKTLRLVRCFYRKGCGYPTTYKAVKNCDQPDPAALRSEKPAVPRKTIGTLTLNIYDFLHTLMSLIFLYKSYSIAVPKYSRPLLLKIYVLCRRPHL